MIEPEAIYIIVDDDEAMRHSLKNLIQSGTMGQNFASVQEFLHSKLTDVHDVQYFA
jgi:FixJ family two-component response regulator